MGLVTARRQPWVRWGRLDPEHCSYCLEGELGAQVPAASRGSRPVPTEVPTGCACPCEAGMKLEQVRAAGCNRAVKAAQHIPDDTPRRIRRSQSHVSKVPLLSAHTGDDGPVLPRDTEVLLSGKQEEHFLPLYPSPVLSGRRGGSRFAAGGEGRAVHRKMGRPLPCSGCLHGKAGGKREIPSCQEAWKQHWALASIHPSSPPSLLPLVSPKVTLRYSLRLFV